MNWTDTTIGDYCPFMYGKGLPRTKRSHGAVPVYGSNGCVDHHSESLTQGPGIVIGRKGSVGAVHLSEKPFWPIDTSFYVEKESLSELKFIYYLLKSLGLEHMNSDSAVPGLNRENAHSLYVNIPELKEDREFLGQWMSQFDDKIELNRQTSQTLEQMAQAVFKSWFVDFDPIRAKIKALEGGEDPTRAAMAAIAGKTIDQLDTLSADQIEFLTTTATLFPNAFEPSALGEIPEGWEAGELNDIAKFSTGRVDLSNLSQETYISTENMLENKRGITSASSLPTVKTVPNFDAGHILISNIRPYFMKIWLARFQGGRSNDVLGFEAKEEGGTEYLYNLLYQDKFFEFMMTTSKGAKMPRGDKDAIMGWSCVHPKLDIKKAYSNLVRVFYQDIEARNVENRSLEQLRDTLLPQLLSGEIELSETP
jgi:type I restriction enzyme S subunit